MTLMNENRGILGRARERGRSQSEKTEYQTQATDNLNYFESQGASEGAEQVCICSKYPDGYESSMSGP